MSIYSDALCLCKNIITYNIHLSIYNMQLNKNLYNGSRNMAFWRKISKSRGKNRKMKLVNLKCQNMSVMIIQFFLLIAEDC